MQKLDYSNLNDGARTNGQIFCDAFVGMGMVFIAIPGILLSILSVMLRSGEGARGYHLGDPWAAPGKLMGAEMFKNGLRRIFRGRSA